MNFTKQQKYLIPVFWFQKDEVEETQVCFESISLKSLFAIWTLFVPVWRRTGQHIIHAMAVIAHGECLSQWLLTFPFTLVFVFLFYLAEKLIRGQRPWPKSILLCMEAQVKDMQFFFLCKLCKPRLCNFAVCSMKNCTESALVLSTNIWKSTKYIILLPFPFSAKSRFSISMGLNLLLELGVSLFTNRTSSFTFCHMLFKEVSYCSVAERYLKEKDGSGAPGVSQAYPPAMAFWGRDPSHPGYKYNVVVPHLMTSDLLTSSHCEFVLVKGLIHQST